MRRNYILTLSALIVVSAGAVAAVPVRAADERVAIEDKIKSMFTITKMDGANQEIMTAGSVLVLHKDGLQMCGVTAKVPMPNVYRNGTITVPKTTWSLSEMVADPALKITDIPTRKFVSDEKFWLIGVSAEKSKVVLKIISDPYKDVRYFGYLEFPYNKKSVPSPDEVASLVMQVVTVDGQKGEAAPAAEEPAAPQPPANDPSPGDNAPIADPKEAPKDAPKTIEVGMTRNEVVDIMGAPDRVAKVGSKEILYYANMKVILVGGKVKDIQ